MSAFADGKIIRIEESPARPRSSCAVIGVYFYDETVFDRIAELRPSLRGELEITDVSNLYLAEGRVSYEVLKGWWTDAGTFDSLYLAGELRRSKFSRPISQQALIV